MVFMKFIALNDFINEDFRKFIVILENKFSKRYNDDW